MGGAMGFEFMAMEHAITPLLHSPGNRSPKGRLSASGCDTVAAPPLQSLRDVVGSTPIMVPDA